MSNEAQNTQPTKAARLLAQAMSEAATEPMKVAGSDMNTRAEQIVDAILDLAVERIKSFFGGLFGK